MQRMLERHSSTNFLKLLLGASVGYYLFKTVSHPSSKLNKRLPTKRIKNIEFFPSIRIARKSKNHEYHLHHWLNFASFYVYLLTRKRKYLRHKIFHGFILGSIYQGLTYKDRFKIIRSLDKSRSFDETAN